MTSDALSDGWRSGLVAEVHAAATAARAARAVPGVVGLQPGLWGLVRQFLADSFQHLTGRPVPDIAGVDADLTPAGIALDVAVITDFTHCAATVAAAVQHAVHTAVSQTSQHPVTQVRVRIVAIDFSQH